MSGRDRLNPPPRLAQLNLLAADDLEPPQPSPPYRSVASRSQVVLDRNEALDSPAYRSQVELMADNEHDRAREKSEYNPAPTGTPRPTEADAQPQPQGKNKVHYPDDVPAPSYHGSPPRGNTDTGHDHDPNIRPPSAAGTDTDEDEDYDWSGEEDLVDQEAKFEQQMGIKRKREGWGFRKIVTLLFSSLIGSTFLAGVIITPAILIHYFWYLKNPTAQREYIKTNVQAWLFWAAANLLISWYLAMIVNVIPYIFKTALALSWGHVSEKVKSKIELYNSVRDSFKPLLYAASAWVSWVIIFDNIYKLHNSDHGNLSRASYTNRVSQAIEFLFFLGLVWSAQRMLSHAIAFMFHRAAYQERIDSLKTSLNVIETLRDYRPKHFRHSSNLDVLGGGRSGARTPVLSAFGFNEKEHFKSLSGALRRATPEPADDGADGDTEGEGHGSKKGKEKRRSKPVPTRTATTTTMVSSEPTSRAATPSGLHRYPPSNSPDLPDRRGGDSDDAGATLVQAAKVFKTAVMHDARNVKGNEEDASLMWNVNSATEAKRLAKSIYMRFRDRYRVFLVPSDFYPAFPTTADAEAAFRVFDKDNNGDISRAEIKTTLLKVYKERRSLSRSMRDVGKALKTLDHILLFFAFIILFFISLNVFGVAVEQSLTSVYTIGIAASFIFKNAASNAFDAVMFLFVTHPFDTGDRCFIGEENLVVKKMGLFATIFTRVDGTETYYFNSQLFTQFITNVRRSGKMFENITIQVAWRTPQEKLDALEKALNEWLSTEENRWYDPSTSLTFQHIDFQRYVEITIGCLHNGNWQDWGLRCQRKTTFSAAVNYYCRQLGITCYNSPQPVTFGDEDTLMGDMPTSPMDADAEGYESPTGSANETQRIPPEELPKENVKSSMGFRPPADTTGTHIRARKSKHRRKQGGMGGDGGF